MTLCAKLGHHLNRSLLQCRVLGGVVFVSKQDRLRTPAGLLVQTIESFEDGAFNTYLRAHQVKVQVAPGECSVEVEDDGTHGQ